MPYHSRELVEVYALEIISRSQAIQEKCKKLLSMDFTSQTPKSLAKTLIRMCLYLEAATKSIFKSIFKSINWENISEKGIKASLFQLQGVDFRICELGAHVRYIDGATTQKLPWSIIKPIEKYIQSLIPEKTIMLRVQWKHNYSVITTDICELYNDYLYEYKDIVEEHSLEKVFEDFNKPFHIISFPSLERKNILLHCLFSHEIGHLISDKYFNKERRNKFVNKIREKINSIVQSTLSTVSGQKSLFEPVRIQAEITQELERAENAWKRGLEEILSDIIGVLLFGPAMLFSTLEIAIQDNMDHKPDLTNNFYPPWRLRLREMLKVIQYASQEFFPFPKNIFLGETTDIINGRFEAIKKITQDESDRKKIQDDPILKVAYKEVDEDVIEAQKYFQEQLKDLIVKPSVLYKRLSHLVDRINNGIPPNAYENSINDREPATIAEIINAAWFHKISWEDEIFNREGSFDESICKKRDMMNRLTLKAIEYADLEKEFRDYYAKQIKILGNEL